MSFLCLLGYSFSVMSVFGDEEVINLVLRVFSSLVFFFLSAFVKQNSSVVFIAFFVVVVSPYCFIVLTFFCLLFLCPVRGGG